MSWLSGLLHNPMLGGMATGGMSAIPGLFQHGGGNGGMSHWFGQQQPAQATGDPRVGQQPPSNVPPGFVDAMRNTNPGYTPPPGIVQPNQPQPMQAGPPQQPISPQHLMLAQVLMGHRMQN